MRSKLLLALACLLVASAASGQSSMHFMRHRQGSTTTSDNVSCSTGGADLVIADPGDPPTYDRLSICFWNSPSSLVNVYVCPGSTTCTTGTGGEFSPGMGTCLDWGNEDGAISCITGSGTANVSYFEERG